MPLRARRLLAPTLVMAAVPAMAAPTAGRPAADMPWGERGHRLAARVAAAHLPAGVPAFFLNATDQLVYLNPEPDRWREHTLTAMDQAFAYDHYIDLENVPADALDAPDRWEYLRRLYDAGLDVPERDAGFLPYRIHELYQRVVTEWRLWRRAAPGERRWIEERIVHDAGILGHYVTDASQPHHTTIHYNGWSADAPNPRGFTTERDFHARFESTFVRAHVRAHHVEAAFPGPPPRPLDDVRAAIFDHVLESHRQVERLYELEQRVRFDSGGSVPDGHRAFAAERLASGAAMLRDLWWNAWLESAQAP
jgi:hypothetical protein